jgi:hypothetical protein
VLSGQRERDAGSRQGERVQDDYEVSFVDGVRSGELVSLVEALRGLQQCP